MLWVKALHLIFMVTWFAGLFYLPRLFVYHADVKDSVSHERFILMERRLLTLTNIGAALTLVFGLWLLSWRPDVASGGWFHAKMGLLVILFGYHHVCARYARQFRENRNTKTARFYRFFNEVPALLLIAIIILATVKPF